MPAHSKTAKSSAQIAVIGIDIGKNVFHLIGLDQRGAIVMKAKLSRGQLEHRLANVPPCLIGMEACPDAAAVRAGWRRSPDSRALAGMAARRLYIEPILADRTRQIHAARRSGSSAGFAARTLFR